MEEVDGSPWRLEKVDSGDEQYPLESCFAVRHTPPDEQDPRFDRSAPTQVRFLHFAERQTPPDEQDPVSTVVGRTQGRSSVLRYARPRFHRLFRPSRLAPDEHEAVAASPCT